MKNTLIVIFSLLCFNLYSQNWVKIASYKKNGTITYLKDNYESYQNDIVAIWEKVEYEIIETEPAVKGNTTNNAMKDATIETGYVVKVPLFISQGERIIISTSDGKYSSRA